MFLLHCIVPVKYCLKLTSDCFTTQSKVHHAYSIKSGLRRITRNWSQQKYTRQRNGVDLWHQFLQRVSWALG